MKETYVYEKRDMSHTLPALSSLALGRACRRSCKVRGSSYIST